MKNEKKFLGLDKNVAMGLAWLLCIFLYIFPIVLLAMEHERMTKDEKKQIVQIFILGVVQWVISIICTIMGSIFLSILFSTISLIVSVFFFVIWIIGMIKAFTGKYWEVPVAWSLADSFVKADGPRCNEDTTESTTTTNETENKAVKFCSHCGAENDIDSQFCAKCGGSMTEEKSE